MIKSLIKNLYTINYYFVQWLFFRICYVEDEAGVILRLGILVPVLPTTGWTTDYKPCKRLTLTFPVPKFMV